jgi:uncharacterized protein (TIGR04255 family)
VLELRDKPLVEAILELRWGPVLTPNSRPPETDPHYRLLVGRLFDRVRPVYSFHEQLEAAQFPDLMVRHIAQHRFRIAPDDWPLIQLGPGLLTLNDTSKYTWTDFRERADKAVADLYEAHPAPDDLRIDQLVLRYIDALRFDHEKDNVLDFLREQLKVVLRFPDELFDNHGIARAPRGLVAQLAFPSREPAGMVGLKIAIGKSAGENAIVLDTSVESRGKDVPKLPQHFAAWLNASHQILSEWFEELTKGELYESFHPIRD